MDGVVAVDVGGTTIKAGRVDRAGRLSAPTTRPTPRSGPEGAEVIEAIVSVVGELTEGGPAPDVGVVVPGVVDDASGVAVWSENLGWRDVPMRAALSERLGVAVAVGHDVRAGGLAEHRVGASRGSRSSAFVPIGTGIAAALVLDGRMYAGDGFAGELGHLDVGHDLPCACGGQGCLEAIASAQAIARRFAESSGVIVGGAGEVAERVRAGDATATAVWDDALDALSRALAALVGLVAPEVVVIGGGLAESADLVIEPVADRLSRRLTFHRAPRLVSASLGAAAGCVGAGLLAWDLVEPR